MNIELDYIKKIAKIVNDNALSEITLKDGDCEITLKKSEHVEYQMPTPYIMASEPEQIQEEKVAETKRIPITSPMVGSFYAASSPNAEPFVKVGDIVGAGQVVCIIEAMKLMNEIESEVSGKIVEICVEDGQSVEYGQTLMYVE